MEMRLLGKSGLHVSALSFGAMTFGDGKGRLPGVFTTEGDTARRQIDICLDAGINLFDSADVYSDGRSEEILGEALGKKRKHVVLATKAFGRMGDQAHDIGLSRRHLIQACEASLRRLGTDWIDLYQVHNFDSLVPLEETLRALDDLVTSGKVRYIGCSNYPGWRLMQSRATSERLGLNHFISQQIQYSLMVRDAEAELLPCGVDQGIGGIIWSPLAQGYLSGKFRSGSDRGQSRLELMNGLSSLGGERGLRIVDTLFEIAASHNGASPSQVALNWLLPRPGVSTLLVGARTEEQLRDNLGAMSWSLSDEEMRRLDIASQTPPNYPESHNRRYASARNPPLFVHHKSDGR